MTLHTGEFLPPGLIAGVYACAYAVRARTLARRGRPVARWRLAAFVAGTAIVAVVQCPPLDELADDVLIAHMAQHLLIGDIASLLIVLGLTGPLLAPVLHLTRPVRPLTHPVAALAIWALVNYVWRVPRSPHGSPTGRGWPMSWSSASPARRWPTCSSGRRRSSIPTTG